MGRARSPGSLLTLPPEDRVSALLAEAASLLEVGRGGEAADIFGRVLLLGQVGCAVHLHPGGDALPGGADPLRDQAADTGTPASTERQAP
jgi:hypothetical protein